MDLGSVGQHGQADQPWPENGRVSARSLSQQDADHLRRDGLQPRHPGHRFDAVRAVHILQVRFEPFSDHDFSYDHLCQVCSRD